jgi:hypothetical protein
METFEISDSFPKKMNFDEEEYKEFQEFQKWKNLRKKMTGSNDRNQYDIDSTTLFSEITYQNEKNSYSNS